MPHRARSQSPGLISNLVFLNILSSKTRHPRSSVPKIKTRNPKLQKHDPNITSIHHVPFLALRSPHLTHKPDKTPHWPPTPSHTLRDTSKHSDHQASTFFLKHLVPRWAGPRAWLTQGASPVWPGVTPFSARCLRKKMKRWMIVEFRRQDRQRFHVRRDPPERERRTHSLSHITEPSTGVPESHMVCTNGISPQRPDISGKEVGPPPGSLAL